MTDKFHIRKTDWQHDAKTLSRIRQTVFVEEQQVPLALELDSEDPTATHFLALTADAEAVGTARLLDDGHVGRMAVLPAFRHQSVGSLLLQAVIREAYVQKLDELFLHAQTSAIGFYEKYGFICEGDEFIDAGIAHRKMTLRLES